VTASCEHTNELSGTVSATIFLTNSRTMDLEDLLLEHKCTKDCGHGHNVFKSLFLPLPLGYIEIHPPPTSHMREASLRLNQGV
jgi:hypothetical protein